MRNGSFWVFVKLIQESEILLRPQEIANTTYAVLKKNTKANGNRCFDYFSKIAHLMNRPNLEHSGRPVWWRKATGCRRPVSWPCPGRCWWRAASCRSTRKRIWRAAAGPGAGAGFPAPAPVARPACPDRGIWWWATGKFRTPWPANQKKRTSGKWKDETPFRLNIIGFLSCFRLTISSTVKWACCPASYQQGVVLLDENRNQSQEAHADGEIGFVQRLRRLLLSGSPSELALNVGREEFDDESADPLLQQGAELSVLDG